MCVCVNTFIFWSDFFVGSMEYFINKIRYLILDLSNDRKKIFSLSINVEKNNINFSISQ